MLDTYTSDNGRDFNARYVETFGWLVADGRRHFVYINNVDHDAVHFSKGGKLLYNAKIDAGVTFEFIPVDRGWYNTINGEVLYLSRVPARQWKRGISSNNTQIREGERMTSRGVEYDVLNSIFCEENEQHRYRAGRACALSKHFAINANGNVWFYNNIIGAIKGDTITLDTTLVATELSDVITRNNIPLKVLVK